MPTPNRRNFLSGAGAATLATAAWVRPFGLAFAATPKGAYTLPPLPYDATALAPYIDAKTMGLHHGKHHAAYVSNLNKALRGHDELAKLPLEELLTKLDEIPEKIRASVRNNGGGHANHSMFWQVMGPAGGDGPEGDLGKAIKRDFGSLEKMQADFNTVGGKRFGSGWVFVTVNSDGKLAITSKPNQDTPIMEGKRVLMGNDVWEHAYYLSYQNKRAEYLKTWWNVVNWQAVGERYAAAKAGRLKI